MARFLVVDDEETIGRTFARMLELDGHQVNRALSAEAGLELAAAERPDAIILDMRMPVMGGLEFLRRIRQDAALRTVPVGIITGDYFLEEDVLAELATHGARLRHKPVFMEDLLALARELLGGDATPAHG